VPSAKQEEALLLSEVEIRGLWAAKPDGLPTDDYHYQVVSTFKHYDLNEVLNHVNVYYSFRSTQL
jgi:hypothetical protein